LTTLYFVDRLPSGSGSYAHYDHRHLDASGWSFHDIRKRISEKQAEWLAQISAWHGELCAVGESLSTGWWLVPGSRIAVWYPFDLKPLLFALGLIDAARTDSPRTLYVVSSPPEVRLLLAEWCGLSASAQVRIGPEPHAAQRDAPNARGIASSATLRTVCSLVLRRLATLRRPTSASVSADAIVISQTLNAGVMERVGDHFWGRMLDELPARGNVGMLWLYQLSRFSDRATIRKHCERLGRRACFVHELVTWTDIWRAFAGARRVRRDLLGLGTRLPVLKVGELSSALFPKWFYRSTILDQWPIYELAVAQAIAACVERSGAKRIAYPYEEKTIERALLLACRAGKPGVRMLAFAHAAYNPGHLYLRRRRTTAPPSADLMLTTGELVRRWLLRTSCQSDDKMQTIGSPRHRGARLSGRPAGPGHWTVPRLLVVPGFGSELRVLAEFVREIPMLFEGWEVTIRPYPFGWEADQKSALAMLHQCVAGLREQGGDLLAQFDWSDCILFASTSAAIEAMLSRRIALRAALNDGVDANPLEGKDVEACVPFCSTAAALKNELDKISSMTADSYRILAERQRRLAESIYSRPDPHRIAQVLFGE
jgi:hypothetical protein